MPGLLSPQFQNEEAARKHLESLLWKDGPVCPKCGLIDEDKSSKLNKNMSFDGHGRDGLHQCKGCRAQFTVTVGTIFEDSHVPLHKWLLAIHLMCSSKKGVSALQIQRNLELGSYRTAWFMCHRIRWAMTQGPMLEKLSGIVEVDETYVGGKQKTGKVVRPTLEGSSKTPVLALVERGGEVRSFPIERATLKNIKPIMEKHIDPTSHLVTDDFPVYYHVRDQFPNHHTANHREKECVRREVELKVTPNTVESFFALLKRSKYGIHHHTSSKYLGSYCAERDFVYNTRKVSDDERTEKALRATKGKRLMLKRPRNVN